MATGAAIAVEDDADRPGPEAIKTAVIEEEPVVETPVIVEAEVVVAMVRNGGPPRPP